MRLNTLKFFKKLIYQCKLHQKCLSCLNEVGKPRLKFPQCFQKMKQSKSIFSSQQINPIPLVVTVRRNCDLKLASFGLQHSRGHLPSARLPVASHSLNFCKKLSYTIFLNSKTAAKMINGP